MNNKNLTPAQIAEINETANFFLNEFLKNGAFLDEHSSKRTGVILDLFTQNRFFASLCIGTIPDEKDIDYGTKLQKYRSYAYNKCEALVDEPKKTTSGETEKFPVHGGIRVNKSLIASVSGQNSIIDLGLITLTMLKCNLLDPRDLQSIQERWSYPLLQLETLAKIIGVRLATFLLWGNVQ
jgi:hypothetical protein